MSAAKLPDDPGLRYLAEILEANGAVAEICDQKWRLAHICTEMTRMMGISGEAAESYLGISPTARAEFRASSGRRSASQPSSRVGIQQRLHRSRRPAAVRPTRSSS